MPVGAGKCLYPFGKCLWVVKKMPVPVKKLPVGVNMEELIRDLMAVLSRHGVNPATYLRDVQIRDRYRQLRRDGVTCKESRLILAEEFYISVKTIERILYISKKKPPLLGA
jgi:hypothetical protein